MGQMMVRFAIGATMIAAACGGGDDGDGNGPTPDGSDDVVCGDGTCTEGQEDQSTCLDDCGAPPNCGDGACGSDESCGLCPADCGECAPVCGDRTCNGEETCASCVDDCACGEGQMCSEGACVAQNPLIDAIPGTWDLIEVDGEPPQESVTVMLTTDTAQPPCGYPLEGDGCVRGFGHLPLVLASTRLYVSDDESDISAEGQVMNDGTRMEYDYTNSVEGANNQHIVWVKQ